MLGSVLVLSPRIAGGLSVDGITVNALFFAGSIPFTIAAAYLQLFQATNAGRVLRLRWVGRHRVLLFGWGPNEIRWLSCTLQFVGTVLFNFNTFDAMLPGLGWLQQDLEVWAPDIAGSILFLAPGYLAFTETCHGHWAWKPRSLSWSVTFISFGGCVAFMISAIFAFVPPSAPDFEAATVSVVFTLFGGICFLIGSLLMLPEAALCRAPR